MYRMLSTALAQLATWPRAHDALLRSSVTQCYFQCLMQEVDGGVADDAIVQEPNPNTNANASPQH